jgi:hypothetical protein
MLLYSYQQVQHVSERSQSKCPVTCSVVVPCFCSGVLCALSSDAPATDSPLQDQAAARAARPRPAAPFGAGLPCLAPAEAAGSKIKRGHRRRLACLCNHSSPSPLRLNQPRLGWFLPPSSATNAQYPTVSRPPPNSVVNVKELRSRQSRLIRQPWQKHTRKLSPACSVIRTANVASLRQSLPGESLPSRPTALPRWPSRLAASSPQALLPKFRGSAMPSLTS